MELDYKAMFEELSSQMIDMCHDQAELGDLTVRVTERTKLTEMMSKNLPRFTIKDQLRVIRILDQMATLAEELCEKYELDSGTEEATDDEY